MSLHEDLSPLNVREVREFLSVWTPCTPDDLGPRKDELMNALGVAIKPYMGKDITPEITEAIDKALTKAAQAFVIKHPDIRITESALRVKLGTFDLVTKMERSGLSVKTIKSLHPILQEEISPTRDQRIRGKSASVAIIDDPMVREWLDDLKNYPSKATGDHLDALAMTVAGLSRRAGESDKDLRARTKQSVQPEKWSKIT